VREDAHPIATPSSRLPVENGVGALKIAHQAFGIKSPTAS